MNRPPRFDRVVLTLIADENDPIDFGVARFTQKPIHLPSCEQAGLVDDPNLLACGIDRIFQQAGNRSRWQPGFRKRFDRPSGRREAADETALLGGKLLDRADGSSFRAAGASLDGRDPIRRA